MMKIFVFVSWFACVVDSHSAQQDVDAHNENFMDPQTFLKLPCPVRRKMRAERALVRLEQHFGSQLVEYERNMAERTRQEVGAKRFLQGAVQRGCLSSGTTRPRAL